MHISLIVAMDDSNAIGSGGHMPWHVPEELRHFRSLTLDHSIIMGRKTFESIGRVLDRRYSIVLTRDADWTHDGVARAATLHDALAAAERATSSGYDATEVFVVGGAQVYALALPRAQRLYLTRMHAAFEADTYFPALDMTEWSVVSSEPRPAMGERTFAMTYQTLERVQLAKRKCKSAND